MATNLLAKAVGDQAFSADFTLAAATLVVASGPTDGLSDGLSIQFKLADATYVTIGKFGFGGERSGVLQAGTYRAVRHGAQAIGLDKA